MPERRIVQGQRVSEGKTIRARQFRREMTASERALWAALRRNQVNGLHFRRQQIIDGFIADFYCHALGLVVEVDGASHHGRADYDRERDRLIAARGLRVLRVRDDEVIGDLAAVVAQIKMMAT